jgi:hypothetical protein
MAESYRRGLFADSRLLRRPKTRLYRRVDIQRPKAWTRALRSFH